MMFRRHVSKDLSSYIDNQLSGRKKAKVENHLKECKFCCEELSKLKLLSDKIKEWRVPALSSNFENFVVNGIVQEELEKEEVKMKKNTLRILIPSGVIAGILVFLFLGQFYVNRGMDGRLRTSTDKIGQQHINAQLQQGLRKYEPYYSSAPSISILEGGNFKEAARKDLSFSRTEGYLNIGESVSNNYAMRNGVYSNSLQIARSAETPYMTSEGSLGKSYPAKTDLPSGESTVIVIQPVLPATGEGERIIRTAQIILEVEDGKVAYKKANDVCQELGGYLSSSNFYKDAEGREAGTITMRIPKDKFLTALDKLGALGKVENSATNSQDVSQEYANLKSRLDAAMVVYNKMLEALQKRQVTIPEAVRLESELTPVLRRIEDLKNQIEYLNNAVSFTTITVNFHEPIVSTKILKETKNDIQQSMLIAAINGVKLFANIIKVLPNIIVFVVWVAVIVGAVFLLKYWITRLFKRE